MKKLSRQEFLTWLAWSSAGMQAAFMGLGSYRFVGKVEWGYQCPCHGSKFDSSGRVLRGPAPKPLPWFKMFQGPDGQLVADTKRPVRRGKFFKLS
jgi:Rieske Fe-S protein